jgi:gliding motility-associated protein GldC
MTSRTAEIRLTVDLDEDKLATRIHWHATEGPDSAPTTCRSMMLSLWDAEKQTAAAIDLWTREMTVGEMNLFFYQVLQRMADTYLRATNNASMAQLIREFGDKFGDACGLQR